MAANGAFKPIDKALDSAQDGKYPSNINGQNSQQPVDKFGRSLLVTESSSSVAFALQTTTTVHVDWHLHGTAQADWHLVVGNVIAVAAAKSVSLLVQRSGIRVIAGGGPALIQTHTDTLAVLADKAVTATLSVDSVEILVRQNIILHGGDSLIQLEGNAATFETSGLLLVKRVGHPFEGPGKQAVALPVLSVGVLPPSTVLLEHTYHDGQGLAGVKYLAKFADGSERQDILDSQGRATSENIPPGSVQVSHGPIPGAFERKGKTPMSNHDPNPSDNKLSKLVDKYLSASSTPTPSA